MQVFRFGLGTRIAITMLFALLLMQGATTLLFAFMPRPHATVYSARWLVAQASAASAKVFGVDASQRKETARAFGKSANLRIMWHDGRSPGPPRPPRKHASPSPSMLRVEARLRQTLGDTVKQVSVDNPFDMPGGPGDQNNPVYIPADGDKSFASGGLSPGEPDIPIFNAFRIDIKGSDGSSLVLEPARPEFMLPFMKPEILTGAMAILLVSALSAWTAKRALAPVDYLVTAAERLGVERHANPIDVKVLGDFAVVGEAINHMQARIKGFVDERTQMLAAVSHDLRTMLTRLRLNAEEIAETEDKDNLVRNIEEMEQMVTATLTFTGYDLNKEPAQSVDLAAMVITLCDSFSDAGARVRYGGPDHIETFCQLVAMKRTFINIIDNAIKYGSEADVEMMLMADDSISITVADRGPGIPPEFVDQALKPFTRLEQSRNRKTGGVGLGLAIANDIVAAHGGSLRLGPREGGGLIVTICLPRRSGPPAALT